MRYEEGSVVDGVLPCLQELTTRTELEDSTIAIAGYYSMD